MLSETVKYILSHIHHRFDPKVGYYDYVPKYKKGMRVSVDFEYVPSEYEKEKAEAEERERKITEGIPMTPAERAGFKVIKGSGLKIPEGSDMKADLKAVGK